MSSTRRTPPPGPQLPAGTRSLPASGAGTPPLVVPVPQLPPPLPTGVLTPDPSRALAAAAAAAAFVGGAHTPLPPDPDGLKNSIRGYKAHFTRALQAADRAEQGVASIRPATAAMLQTLKLAQDKADLQFDKLLRALHALEVADPDELQATALDAEAASRRRDDAHLRLLACMAAVEASVRKQARDDAADAAAIATAATAAQPGAAAADRRPAPKANMALKPQELSRDASPTEMQVWLAQLRAYFSSSGFDRCSVPDAQAYLLACLDPALAARIRPTLTDTTPIFGKVSATSTIETEFLLANPLFSRRLEFFRAKQSAGEPFTDFAIRVRNLANMADLDKIKPDDIMIIGFIMGTTDDKLREKFLKDPEPTLDGLRLIARNYEIAAAATSTMAESSGFPARCQRRRPRQRGEHRPGWKPDPRGTHQKPSEGQYLPSLRQQGHRRQTRVPGNEAEVPRVPNRGPRPKGLPRRLHLRRPEPPQPAQHQEGQHRGRHVQRAGRHPRRQRLRLARDLARQGQPGRVRGRLDAGHPRGQRRHGHGDRPDAPGEPGHPAHERADQGHARHGLQAERDARLRLLQVAGRHEPPARQRDLLRQVRGRVHQGRKRYGYAVRWLGDPEGFPRRPLRIRQLLGHFIPER